MSLNFKLSEEEAQAIHSAMNELKASLEMSAALAENALKIMHDNFASIDAEYKKELDPSMTKIGAALWKINLNLHKMRNYQSRIVAPIEESGQS